MLSGVHTHFLALGMIVLLLVLALEKQFHVSESRLFDWFFWVYNGGLVLTAAMMTLHGSLTILGKEASPMIAGMAGLGHMAMTAAFILFFLSLGKALTQDRRLEAAASPVGT